MVLQPLTVGRVALAQGSSCPCMLRRRHAQESGGRRRRRRGQACGATSEATVRFNPACTMAMGRFDASPQPAPARPPLERTTFSELTSASAGAQYTPSNGGRAARRPGSRGPRWRPEGRRSAVGQAEGCTHAEGALRVPQRANWGRQVTDRSNVAGWPPPPPPSPPPLPPLGRPERQPTFCGCIHFTKLSRAG